MWPTASATRLLWVGPGPGSGLQVMQIPTPGSLHGGWPDNEQDCGPSYERGQHIVGGIFQAKSDRQDIRDG